MTIPQRPNKGRVKFALIPTTCFSCGRLFIFEEYIEEKEWDGHDTCPIDTCMECASLQDNSSTDVQKVY